MAERSSLKPAAISAPTLTPQGQLAGKPAMPLSRPFTLVGSRNRAHLHLISSSISRNHCCIIVTDNGLYLRDLASRTGAVVNGRKVKESDLRDGDVIQVGSFKFKFADPAGPVRFPITPKAAGAVLHFSGVNTEIDSRTLTIGRRSNCDISLDDDGVSNTHAIVFESNGERFIRDLGSRTGTLVNGRPIHHQLLNFGDTIRIGSTEIRYNASDAADDVAPHAESELEPLSLDPIELEPIELDPIDQVERVVQPPTPTFPRMVDLSRQVPLDKDPGDFVDDEETPRPIEVGHTEDSHHGNGAIPIEESATPAQVEPVALEPVGLEPVADATSSISPAASFTLVPQAPDPKADSIYAMNFASTPGIFTAATPTEPTAPELAEPAAAEGSAIPHAENIAEPIPLETAEPEPTLSVVAEDFHAEQPLAIEEVEAPVAASEPEPAITDQVTDSNAVEQVEPITADPVVEEAGFTAPIEVEPDVVAESSTDDPRASEPNDFTPTLDVASADAPTGFEGLTAFEEDSIAPARQTGESVEPPTATANESRADDTAWTLSVGSTEESGAAATSSEARGDAEVEPTEVVTPATEGVEQLSVTADASDLPGEVDVTTSTTLEHPVRPELPPDAETPTVDSTVAIAPAPGPDLSSVAGVAAAATAGITLGSPATRRGRGRPKADPKPAPAPKSGRKKKTSDVPPVVAEAPAPVVEDPTIQVPPGPSPKKRGGSRKKAAPQVVQLPPPEMEAVESNSATDETPVPVEEPYALSEPLAEAPGEPMSAVNFLTADSTVPPETTELQDFTNSVSESAFGMDQAEAPRMAEDLTSEIRQPEAVSEEQPESTPAAEPGSVRLESDSPFDLPAAATGFIQATAEPDALEPVLDAPAAETWTEESISKNAAADIELTPIEVLEPTDPTPESAQVLEPELETREPDVLADEPRLDETMAGLSLTDTAFGRAVVDLGSADSAPLVEETSPQTVDEEPPTEVVESAETLPVDDAVGAAANDTLIPADEKVDTAIAEARGQDIQAEDEETDSDFAIPEIKRAAHVDLVDDSPAGDATIEPVGGADLITLDPDVPTAEAVAEEHRVHVGEVPQTPASAASDDFDLPDVDLNIDLEGDDESGLGLGHDDIELIVPPEAGSERSLDHAFEPESLSSTNVSQPPPASQPPAAPAVQTAPASGPAMDPFFGMNRDLASFLGGVPLTLTSAAPIAPVADSGLNTTFSAAGTIQGSPSPLPATVKQMQPEPTPPSADEVSELEDDIPEIDFSTTDEPLDLFEDAPHKLDEMPDSLAPISDVSHVLSPAEKPAPTPAAPPTPPASQTLLNARPAPPPMRGVTPPPPPKSSPLRSFTSNISITPPPMVPGTGAPVSFGGAPAAAGLTAPFGALGTPQTRQVDVFSHTAFPPLDPSVFSAPQRPASPRTVTPGAASQRRDAEEEETSTADDVLAIELDSMPDLSTTPVRRTAIPPNRQTPTARPATAPAKKPWWKSLKILLPLVIFAIIVVILVVMFFPPKHTVQGTLQIRGLDPDNQAARRAHVVAFRNLITDPHVQRVASANVNLKEHGIGPGFLNDPLALAALADSNTSPFVDSRGQLLLNRSTTDVAGDSMRMAALMDAIFAESGTMNAQAASSQADRKRRAEEAADQEKQRQAEQSTIDGIGNQLLIAGGTSAANWLLNPQAAVAQLQIDDADSRLAVDSVAADVQKKRQALQDAQSAAAPVDANVAAESLRVKKAIADLNVRLDAVRLAQAGHVDESAKRFASSLDAIDKALSDAAGGTLAAAPVTDARNAVSEIRELDSNLAAKTRDDSKTVAQLRRQIADQRESHLRQIWSGDASLQALVEERNAQAHRYGAAIDSNYVDEAAKIKGVLEELERKIESRRSELATGSQFTDPLQQTLQQTIDRTEAARQAGEAQMTQKLQAFATMFSGGAAASLSAAPKLSQAASDSLVARQAYTAAASLSATSADAEARRLQLQIAEQQARLDSLQQEPGTAGPADAARRELDAAQTAEAKATAAYTTAHNSLALVRQLVAERGKLDLLAESLKLAQKTAGDSTASPELVKPDDASVNRIYARDQRFIYLIAGLAAVLLAFAVPLWLTIHDMSRDRHAVSETHPLIRPLEDPSAPALISSDRDLLFEPDAAHA